MQMRIRCPDDGEQPRFAGNGIPHTGYSCMMEELPDPVELDYSTPPPQAWRGRPPESAAERRWRHWRVAYYARLIFAFVVAGLYLGPNWILFRKLIP